MQPRNGNLPFFLALQWAVLLATYSDYARLPPTHAKLTSTHVPCRRSARDWIAEILLIFSRLPLLWLVLGIRMKSGGGTSQVSRLDASHETFAGKTDDSLFL